MTETRICAYSQCEVEFEPKRPHHRFHSEACRYGDYLERQENGREARAQRVGAHDLDEVRARGEESKGDKARWALIVREHIAHTLTATGYVSAEDLDALGIPPEHVNIGNSWLGHFSKRRLMAPVIWRYSSKPSRKGGKVWTYRITEKGREELPALLSEVRSTLARYGAGDPAEGNGSAGTRRSASAVSGEASRLDTTNPEGQEATGSHAPALDRPGGTLFRHGETGAGSSRGVEPEPALFDADPPSMYDPFSEAA